MLEKPDLADEAILACLYEQYRIAAIGLEFLPIGNEATAWVYRVIGADGQRWFLKIRKGEVYQSSLTIPHYLKDRGIKQVVAPMLALNKRLWLPLEHFTLTLYPYIDGKTGMEIGMSDIQWMELGRVLKQIHRTQLPDELSTQIRRETFIPQWSKTSRELDSKISIGDFDHSSPTQSELAAFWRSRQAEINTLIDRTEALGRHLRQNAGEFVLCHTDIHTANVLLDQQGDLFVVDWDQPILAPVERDLMFTMASAAPDEHKISRSESMFFKGYGKAKVDPVAFAYYRYEWVVQEIGDYGERVFLTSGSGEETRLDSVRGFKQLFDPGDVVDEAYRSEKDVPPEFRHEI